MQSVIRLVFFIDMNTYVSTRGRNFKSFLKETYEIALDSCYLLTNKMLNMELNMIIYCAYGVCIHETFLNFTLDLVNSLQFKQMLNSA